MGWSIAKVAALISVPAVLLTGCVPYRELKNESIVEGMGIDSSGSGYNLTFQIFSPSKSSGSGDSGGSGGSGGSTNKATIMQSGGGTLFDGVRSATLQQGRKLYFTNSRAYVLGENACKNNFMKIVDFLQRNHEIRESEHIYIAKGSAKDVLTAKKNDQVIPASNLELISEDYYQTSKTAEMQLSDLYRTLSNGITDPVIPVVNLKKDKSGQIEYMDGSGVIHNGKLIGFLDNKETRGYLWTQGLVKGGVISVKLPNGGKASMEIVTSSASIKTSVDSKGKPVIDINVKYTTDITEIGVDSHKDINIHVLDEFMKLQDKVVQKEITSALDKSLRTFHADIFGFGMNIFESHPEVWRKLESKWYQQLPSLKINLHIKSTIESSGLISKY